MDDIRELARKGEDLTWKDFDVYLYEDIGSGLYIRKYEVDENYYVLVSGGSLSISPMQISLVKANGEPIDIRHDDIDLIDK
ncbi:hypothetical protein [Paenibacillus sp. sgz500958]|uniref:hypothetical protein n=1 Tax=Paenibacillus sp. sgz500958 TaxID=3242475 RepID=UPI0036D234A7